MAGTSGKLENRRGPSRSVGEDGKVWAEHWLDCGAAGRTENSAAGKQGPLGPWPRDSPRSPMGVTGASTVTRSRCEILAGQPLQTPFSSSEGTSLPTWLTPCDLPPSGLLATGCHGDHLQMPHRSGYPHYRCNASLLPVLGDPVGSPFQPNRPHTEGVGRTSVSPRVSRSLLDPQGSTARVLPRPKFSLAHLSMTALSLSSEDSGEPGWRPSCVPGLWATARPSALSRGSA